LPAVGRNAASPVEYCINACNEGSGSQMGSYDVHIGKLIQTELEEDTVRIIEMVLQDLS